MNFVEQGEVLVVTNAKRILYDEMNIRMFKQFYNTELKVIGQVKE